MGRRDLERWFKHRAHALAAQAIGSRGPRPVPANIQRILVTKQHNQLGDFILSTPLIASLASAFPGASIDYLASPLQAEAASLVPGIRRVWLLRGRGVGGRSGHLPALIRGLRAHRYDLAISVTTVSYSATSALLIALSGARFLLAGHTPHTPPGKSLFDVLVPIPEGIHETDRALAHLAGLGVKPSTRVARMCVPREEALAARTALVGGETSGATIGIHPGAGKAPNRWPPSAFGWLARALLERDGNRLVLFAGPREEPLLDAMQLPADPRVVRIVGQPLRAVAAVMQGLTAYVGNDTGTLHVAAALDVPVLGLFGPTDPAIWTPIGPRVRTLRAPGERLDDLDPAAVLHVLDDMLIMASADVR